MLALISFVGERRRRDGEEERSRAGSIGTPPLESREKLGILLVRQGALVEQRNDGGDIPYIEPWLRPGCVFPRGEKSVAHAGSSSGH